MKATRAALRVVTGDESRADDAAALARVAAGDSSALGEVFDRHARPLLRFVTRVAGPLDAEDVVQNTFVRASSLAAAFDDRAPTARPWLFGIASRIVLERRRAFARFARALATLGASEPPPPISTSLETERMDLREGLEKLSAVKRIVIVLAEVEGYRCEEIAKMLEIPVGTVWTRLHHARAELRKHLEEVES